MAPESERDTSLGAVDHALLQAAFEQGAFDSLSGVDVSALAERFDLPEPVVRQRLSRAMAVTLRAYRDSEGAEPPVDDESAETVAAADPPVPEF